MVAAGCWRGCRGCGEADQRTFGVTYDSGVGDI